MKNLALTLCLLLPVAVFAQDPVAPAPPVDAPANPALTPNDAQPKPELVPNEHARWCGAHGCGGGGHKGAGAVIVTTTVLGTVLTAVAVGVAVSVATSHQGPGQVR